MLCLFCPAGERYTAGVGQVESSDEIRREIVHQLCIRPMAHSELVKALPENVSQPSRLYFFPRSCAGYCLTISSMLLLVFVLFSNYVVFKI